MKASLCDLVKAPMTVFSVVGAGHYWSFMTSVLTMHIFLVLLRRHDRVCV